MEAIDRLRRQSAALLASSASLTVAVALFMDRYLSWATGALVVQAVEGVLLWRGLQGNRAPSGDLFPSLGAANRLTLVRGWLIAAFAGVLCAAAFGGGSRPPTAIETWAPASLYTAALLLDYIDGLVARLTHRVSGLGRFLENEFDSLGVLVATSFLAFAGRVQFWIIVAGLLRYLFLFGVWARLKAGLTVRPLRHSPSGKVIAGLMMGYLSVALWPIVPAGFALAGAAVFFVPFVCGFARDWLEVTGAIDPESAGYRRFKGLFDTVAFLAVPVLLRIALPALIVLLFDKLPLGFMLIAAVGGLLVFTGCAGRTAGLVVAGAAVFQPSGVSPLALTVTVVALLVLLCGSGPLSAWKPEERIFGKRSP